MTKQRVRIGAAAGVVLLAGLLVAWSYFSVRVSTDDAQIDGHVNAVAARVGGTVTAVLVADNQLVEAGTTLVRIEARPYEIAVARAAADLAENEAQARAAHTGVPVTSTTSTSQETAAASDLAGAEARLVSAHARVREAVAKDTRSAQDLARLKPLLAKDEVSQQEYDMAVSEADAAHAARESADASVREAEKAVEAAKARLAQAKTGPEQVTIQKARADSAAAKADVARATLAQARLDLEHTEIKAAVAGIVSRKSVELGQVVQAGPAALGAWCRSTTSGWSRTSRRRSSTQMRPARPRASRWTRYGGQRLPRARWTASRAATGARFSLLPPENATGNYVKVVQRVPVKIVLDAGQDPDHLLRPGMSVVPTVLTR